MTQSMTKTATVKISTVLTVAGLGMFVSALDSAIINVALPTLQEQFQTNAIAATWMVTSYVIAIAATIVLFGRLADRIGRARIAQGGFLLFALSSIVCSVSDSSMMMILGRIFQGVGAAMLQATGPALITTLIEPDQRGKAMGYLGMLIGLGPIVGPAAGGFLLFYVGWQWIFLINLPICLIGMIGCRRLLAIDQKHIGAKGYDLPGSLLLVLGIVGGMSVLSQLEAINTMGTTAIWKLGILLAASILCLGAFVWREGKARDPIIAISWFASPARALNLLSSLLFGAVSAIIFIVPPYLFGASMDERQIGLMALAAPVGLVASSMWGGKNMRRFHPAVLMRTGFLLMCISFVCLALFAEHLAVWMYLGLFLLFGVGGGLFQPANTIAVMASVEQKDQSTIGAALRLFQNVGVSFGATSGILLSSAWGTPLAWLFAAILMVVGSVGMVTVTLSFSRG